jgi:hypothetical protein
VSLSKNGGLILAPLPQDPENKLGAETKTRKNECCRRLAMRIALVNDIARTVLASEKMDDFLGQACQSIRQALDYEPAQIWSARSWRAARILWVGRMNLRIYAARQKNCTDIKSRLAPIPVEA